MPPQHEPPADRPPSPDDKPARRHIPPADLVLALVLALAGAAAAYHGSRGIDTLLVRGAAGNAWFEADCARVFVDATTDDSAQSRSAVHPLFALLTNPLVALLNRAFGFEPVVALRVLRALTAAGCAAATYALLRILLGRRLDSLLFTILAAVSASAMFWFVVPETYPPGLLSILFALGVVAIGEGRRLSPLWNVAANLATFAFTITNCMAGLLATFSRQPLRRAVVISLVSICFLLGLMALQQQVFPSAVTVPVSLQEASYVLRPEAGGPLRAGAAFVFHSLVMPEIKTVQRYSNTTEPIMTVQHSLPGSAGPWGYAAATLWIILLALGLYGMYVHRPHRGLRFVLGLTLIGQLGLHLLYGLETFLYSCHFGALLVLVAAFATLTPARRIAIVLAVGLTICAGLNNLRQLKQAQSFVEQRAGRVSQVFEDNRQSPPVAAPWSGPSNRIRQPEAGRA